MSSPFSFVFLKDKFVYVWIGNAHKTMLSFKYRQFRELSNTALNSNKEKGVLLNLGVSSFHEIAVGLRR